MFTFLMEVKAELDKVTWPTSQDVSRLTFIVLGISVIVGVYLGAMDFVFTSLLGFLIQ